MEIALLLQEDLLFPFLTIKKTEMVLSSHA